MKRDIRSRCWGGAKMPEFWDSYNDKGEKCDVTLIRGEKIPDGLYHLVCDVLIRHVDGSFLLMQRSYEKKRYGGYVEATAGGAALQGESPLQCIKRELEEETGIVTDRFSEVNRVLSKKKKSIFHCFVSTVDIQKDSIRCQEGETIDYIWVDEKDFPTYLASGKMVRSATARYRQYLQDMGIIR
jgi:8-oxo-dGTP pyrophosphatase MutT (NUDIX family)